MSLRASKTQRNAMRSMIILGFCLGWFSYGLVAAQGPGMGGGDGAGPAALEQPRFRERIWEAGGPRISPAASGKLILSVTVDGNRSVSENRVLSHMQSRPDRVFDKEQLNRDIRELYRTDLFERIEASVGETDEGVHLKLTVRERPMIGEVIFHGNEALNDRRLSKFVGLNPGDPINPFAVESARNRLIELYQDEGFNHADVQVVSGHRRGDRDVVFRISEGECERIWAIRFVGNSSFTDSLLAVKIRSRDAGSAGWRSYLNNKAIRSQLEGDKQTLVGYYRALGYLNAQIDYELEYSDSGKWVTVTFVIDEGPRFRVEEVLIQGNRYFTTAELDQLLQLRGGDYFHQGKMAKDTRRLREIYGGSGFIFSQITPTPIYLEPGRMNLMYEIEEGDVYRLSEIKVHINGGTSYTKHSVVLNQLGDLRPGKIIDSREVTDAERRMRFSEIFQNNPALGEPPRIEISPPTADDFELP